MYSTMGIKVRYKIIWREYGKITLLDTKTWYAFDIDDRELINYMD